MYTIQTDVHDFSLIDTRDMKLEQHVGNGLTLFQNNCLHYIKVA